MYMSDNEICLRVRRNGGSYKYIHVLAELNACTMRDIEAVLQRNHFKYSKGVWTEQKSCLNIPQANNTLLPEQENMESTKTLEYGNLKVLIHPDKSEMPVVKAKIKRERKVMTTVDKSVREQVAKEYLETGTPYSELAQKYGISKWMVGDSVKKYKQAQAESADLVEGPFESSTVKAPVLLVTPSSVLVPIELITGLDKKVLEGMYSSLCDTIEVKKQELQGFEKFKTVLESLLAKA